MNKFDWGAHPPGQDIVRNSIFDSIIDRSGTGSLKWDRYAGRDILPLWVADTDFMSPPAVRDALQRRVQHGVFGYTHPTKELNDTVCAYLRREHAVEVDSQWIVWLPGCVPALSMACASRGEPGDRVLTCTPVYPPFLHVHRDSRRELDLVPLLPDSEGYYRLDWKGLESAVTPRTRVFLFCNPQNPTGRVFTADEVERVADFCQRHQLVLCSDEIHCDLILEPSRRHYSVLRLPPAQQPPVIALMAASKTYNIAGLACAVAIVPNSELRRKFLRSAGKLLPEISPLSFVATEAAYRDGDSWRQELLEYLRQNRDVIASFLAEHVPQVSMTPLEATYLAWLDVRALDLDNPHAFFEQHGLGFSNGVDFGAPGFLRMNFGCRRSLLHEALQRFQRAVAAAMK